jgi:DNA-directed RNA polymerase sigma subunit (sigma70/sigma32)
MTVLTREAMVNEAMPLIAIAARKFRMPPGVNIDDLESVGNEALNEASVRFDQQAGIPWKNFAYSMIKNWMRNEISARRRHPTATLQPVHEGKELPPPVDTKASDPCELAQVRELVTRPKTRLRQVEQYLPSPSQVADQVTRLRAAMFGAVSEDDVAEVMGAVLKKAKAGDMRAATLVTDLLAPARSGVTVHQQAVVIRSGDIE